MNQWTPTSEAPAYLVDWAGQASRGLRIGTSMVLFGFVRALALRGRAGDLQRARACSGQAPLLATERWTALAGCAVQGRTSPSWRRLPPGDRFRTGGRSRCILLLQLRSLGGESTRGRVSMGAVGAIRESRTGARDGQHGWSSRAPAMRDGWSGQCVAGDCTTAAGP